MSFSLSNKGRNKKGDTQAEGDLRIAPTCRDPLRRWRETCVFKGAADNL